MHNKKKTFEQHHFTYLTQKKAFIAKRAENCTNIRTSCFFFLKFVTTFQLCSLYDIFNKLSYECSITSFFFSFQWNDTQEKHTHTCTHTFSSNNICSIVRFQSNSQTRQINYICPAINFSFHRTLKFSA